MTEKAETSQDNTSSSTALRMMMQELPQQLGMRHYRQLLIWMLLLSQMIFDKMLNYVKQTFPNDARLALTNLNFIVVSYRLCYC